MRNIKIFYLINLVVLVIVSCQKPYQVPDVSRAINADSSHTGLLQKQVLTYLPESFENMIFEYVYDTAGRLAQRYYHVKIKKTLRSPQLLQHRTEHVEGEHIKQKMKPSAMHEHVRNHLPDLEIRRTEREKGEIGFKRSRSISKKQLRKENHHIGDEQVLNYRW